MCKRGNRTARIKKIWGLYEGRFGYPKDAKEAARLMKEYGIVVELIHGDPLRFGH